MNWMILRNISFVVLVLFVQGCAMSSMTKTSRWAFYPPLEPLVNPKPQSGKPIAQRITYAWQTVFQELAPGMKMREQTDITSVGQVGNVDSLVKQAQQRADNSSEQRRIQSNLASTAKNRGDARYHHSMARLHADQAYVQQKMAIATGNINASIGLVNSTMGVYSSMAAAGKKLGNTNYRAISKNISTDLNLLGTSASPGSILHFEFHYGLEPSKGKNFKAGLAMMFGGSSEANNEFMVTAVLTQPGGKRITATRLVKMIWYSGEANVGRPFPDNYKVFSPHDLPDPRTIDVALLNYKVLNVLARTAVEDIRKKLK